MASIRGGVNNNIVGLGLQRALETGLERLVRIVIRLEGQVIQVNNELTPIAGQDSDYLEKLAGGCFRNFYDT